MPRRQWNANTKAKVVIQGLQGKPVADICNEHLINQSQYYQWRDQFLAHAAKAFEIPQHHQKEARLARENTRVKTLVGGAHPRIKKKRRAAGVKRRSSLLVARRNDGVLPSIQALKAEHPCWGYRRVWAYLRFVEKLPVNKKRILRLMQEHHLVVTPHVQLKAKRTPTRSKPRPTKPHAWWGIDMTKVLVEGSGWVYIVLVLDWSTKKIVGYYAGMSCPAQQWLVALEMAVNRQFPDGARGQGVCLMSDNGCQPTAVAFMQACHTLGIQQTFTSYNNPKGDTDTERMMRTLKEECLWLQEWTCPFALVKACERWITDDNEHYLHSALGYKPPRQFEREYCNRHSTPFVAA